MLVGAGIASCARGVAPIPSLYDALGSPWARLYYPGSSARCHTASGASASAGGGLAPAFATTVLTTRAPPSALLYWYDSSLTKWGWHSVAVRKLRGAQLAAEYFAKGDALFEVAIDDPSRLARAGCRVASSSGVTYEVSYILVPPEPRLSR